MKKRLDSSNKQRLTELTRIIIANPFAEERTRTESCLTGLPAAADREALFSATLEIVRETILGFRTNHQADVRLFHPTDRQLIANLFLFHTYHRYTEMFDSHIEHQIRSGPRPVVFEQADAILADLAGYGFSDEEAERYLAIFFQMRRAYYFIDTTLPGTSDCMRHLRIRLWNNIFTSNLEHYVETLWNRMEDFSTLLLGETGTGKGVAAAAIGRTGYIPYNRRKKTFAESFTGAFLSINLSQFPEQLIESELFGHAKGAFTGAIREHAGVFTRSSSHGSVFLDEIGEVTVPVQVKLLRILQERIFLPVGSDREQRFSGRVIAATNKDIARLLQQKTFREDFFYRLSSDIITIPPLRQRILEDPQELQLLTGHLVKRITGTAKESLAEFVLDKIKQSLPARYPWHGNVRELEQCCRQILINNEYSSAIHRPKEESRQDVPEKLLQGELSIAELTSWYCHFLYQTHGTYQEVSRRTGLDRRTVKKHLDS